MLIVVKGIKQRRFPDVLGKALPYSKTVTRTFKMIVMYIWRAFGVVSVDRMLIDSSVIVFQFIVEDSKVRAV